MEWGSYYLGNVFEEWPGEVRRPWNGTKFGEAQFNKFVTMCHDLTNKQKT